MQPKELKNWSRDQLMLRSARLNGEIDGLVGYRQDLYEELQKTVKDVSNIEELRRSIDIGQDQDTLEHLRKREMDLRQEVRELSTQIESLSKELEPIEHELAGRPVFDYDYEKDMKAWRRDTERQLKQIRNRHLGLLGRLRVWLFGR
ncbi:hypothetical protein BVY00_00735 [bacterium G20]|nr:hypothetical protein BVY00_00735 [bacterium G20]